MTHTHLDRKDAVSLLVTRLVDLAEVAVAELPDDLKVRRLGTQRNACASHQFLLQCFQFLALTALFESI